MEEGVEMKNKDLRGCICLASDIGCGLICIQPLKRSVSSEQPKKPKGKVIQDEECTYISMCAVVTLFNKPGNFGGIQISVCRILWDERDDLMDERHSVPDVPSILYLLASYLSRKVGNSRKKRGGRRRTIR